MALHWGEYADSHSCADLLSPHDFLLSSYKIPAESASNVPPTFKIKDEERLPSNQVGVNRGIVEHTIQLEQYRSKLHTLIGVAVQQLAESGVEQTTPDIQECPSPPPCSSCHHLQSRYADVSNRDFIRGVGKAPDKVTPSTCNHLLRQAIAQLALHQGYEEAAPSALDALTGACQVFYKKLLSQLRHNVDMEREHGYTGFQDCMHRTLAQVGHRDLSHLLSDYHHSTALRHSRLVTTCADLHAAYRDIQKTREVPEQLFTLIPSLSRDYHSTVLSLSDNDDKSEGSGNVVELEDVLGEDNDAEKLLELAGLSGFDITIEPETLQQVEDIVSTFVEEPLRPAGKSKSKGKALSSSAKRRKKS